VANFGVASLHLPSLRSTFLRYADKLSRCSGHMQVWPVYLPLLAACPNTPREGADLDFLRLCASLLNDAYML
jgi:hypothetical protein